MGWSDGSIAAVRVGGHAFSQMAQSRLAKCFNCVIWPALAQDSLKDWSGSVTGAVSPRRTRTSGR